MAFRTWDGSRLPEVQAVARPIGQELGHLAPGELGRERAEVDAEGAVPDQLGEAPTGQAADRVDHGALQHRAAEGGAEAVEAG